MKIIVAPDSFKGSCSAICIAHAIESGIKKVFPNAQIVKIPIADGGEGTVEALLLGCGGEMKQIEVVGPMGEMVTAKYGVLRNGSAVIEMAVASGLTLVAKEKRNPLVATTYGTGQLIKAALDEGCHKIIIGIGGSATNDGGVGMAQALGVSFQDEDGNELGNGGGELYKLSRIDLRGLDPRLGETEVVVACDVSNPLTGPEGAVAVYGPQKGATPEDVKLLDENLRHYARIIKEQLGIDISHVPGAGAAGGMGAGLMVFCSARLQTGIETVMDVVGFDRYLKDAELVVTGEGQIDGQSVYGKVPVGVAKRAKKFNLPVLVVTGGMGSEAHKVYDYGIDAIMSIPPGPISLREAMEHCERLVEEAAERMMRMLQLGMAMK